MQVKQYTTFVLLLVMCDLDVSSVTHYRMELDILLKAFLKKFYKVFLNDDFSKFRDFSGIFYLFHKSLVVFCK